MRAEQPGVRDAGPTRPTQITAVSGGTQGVSATYARMISLAAAYDAAGDEMRGWAGEGLRTLSDADLLESSVLSPATFAAAEVAVVAATTGPDGVLVDSCAWEVDALTIQVTVSALRETDAMVHSTFEALDYVVGRSLGYGLGAGGLGLLVAGGLGWQLLPPATRGRARDRARDEAGGALGQLEDWATAHPLAFQHLLNGGGGLLDGLWDGLTPVQPGGPLGLTTFTSDTESAAGLLAMLYGSDGRPSVTRSDAQIPGGHLQPVSVQGLIEHLRDVAALSDTPDSPNNGTIEVQSFPGADGHLRHIVYLPGTDDLTTVPWTQDDDVRDMGTNLLLIGGADNAYQEGIVAAMHTAGIGANDPVLLVGHSQGGMEAVAIASQGSGGFHVTDVVTAGAPTAQVDGFPPGVHVTSLEHRGDVVPLLDGESNPDSAQQVTVRFDDGLDPLESGLVGNHGYGHYVNGAAAVDASLDPSVRAHVDALRHRGFLPGAGFAASDQVTSQVLQITRQP